MKTPADANGKKEIKVVNVRTGVINLPGSKHTFLGKKKAFIPDARKAKKDDNKVLDGRRRARRAKLRLQQKKTWGWENGSRGDGPEKKRRLPQKRGIC